jgi:hypothetical protein
MLTLGLAGLVLSGCAGSGSKAGAPTAVASSSPTPASLEDAWKVRLDGAGPVKVGMTLDEASKAANAPVWIVRPPSEPGGCTYARVEGGPAGLSLMVVGDRIARVDVQEGSSVETAEGAKVGVTEAAVKALYPGIRVEPAKYLVGGHDLVHDAGESKIVFETDGSKVTNYHAGKEPEVSYSEGCS